MKHKERSDQQLLLERIMHNNEAFCDIQPLNLENEVYMVSSNRVICIAFAYYVSDDEEEGRRVI